MRPFENESDELEIGDLKIENRLDRLTLYGRVDLTRDGLGLRRMLKLYVVLHAAIDILLADPNLSDRVPEPDPLIHTKPNPFSET
jgi:hypothetical protein